MAASVILEQIPTRWRWKRFYLTDSVEATGGVNVERAHVGVSGLVKTAAAPWTPLPVCPKTRRYVTAEDYVNAARVGVCLGSAARPARNAPFASAFARSTRSARSAERSEQELTRTRENRIYLKTPGQYGMFCVQIVDPVSYWGVLTLIVFLNLSVCTFTSCDRDCGHLALKMVETKEELQGRLCKLRTSDDFCFFYYSSLPSSGQLTVARAKECWSNIVHNVKL